MNFPRLFMIMNLAYLCARNAQTQIACDVNSINFTLEEVLKKDQNIQRELMDVLSEYQKTGEGTLKLMKISIRQNKLDRKN